MAKLALFGGTFNPIHNGHLNLAAQFVREVGFERVVFIPAKIPPHKDALDLIAPQYRLQMVQLAVDGIPGFEVSGVELAREGLSYTVDTLREFHRENPQDELFLIVGSDMFFTLDQWYCIDEIFSLATICCAAREPGIFHRMTQFAQQYRQRGGRCIVLNVPVMEISSTQIRQAVRHGQSIHELVPAPVEEYILKEDLYQESHARRVERYQQVIRSMLREKRVQHSLNVAEQAVHLAKIHGVNEKKAQIAGLLHDVCKNMKTLEMLKWITGSGIAMDNITLRQQQLWHAVASSAYAQNELDIYDPEILNAIRYHTTARRGMSPLEQVIYLADVTSSERDYPGVQRMRLLAEKSLKEAMRESLKFILGDLTRRNLQIVQDTWEAYNEYIL